MTNSTNVIEEIEAPEYLNDPEVLAYLEGTDADMGRLVLEEDGKLWAYSRRSPESLCKACLIDMVALTFPRYADAAATVLEAPVAVLESSVEPKGTQAPEAVTPRPARKSRRKAGRPHVSQHALPKTGEPRGMLADFAFGKTGKVPPRIVLDGALQTCPAPTVTADSVRIVVANGRDFQGYALLERAAYDLLITSAQKPDTYMFRLIDGAVSTRIRRSPTDTYTQPVDALLGELGTDARVTLELLHA